MKNFFVLLFLLTLFLIPTRTEAAYTPSIVCPNDGKSYVVVVKNSDPETAGPKEFDPISGSEHCVEGKMGTYGTKFEDLVKAKVYTVLDGNKDVTIEVVECAPATFGGSDKYDWQNGKSWKLSTNSVPFMLSRVPINSPGLPVLPTICPASAMGSGNEMRIRYVVAGTYMYVIGEYKAPSGPPVDPTALKAYCGPISSKDACNKDANCEWGGSNFCYPKGLVPASGGADGDGPSAQFICSSLMKEPVCASGGTECQAACLKNSGCVFFQNKCVLNSDLSPGDQQKAYTDAFKKSLEDKYQVPDGNNFLPDCAYPGTCDDVNDLLILLINIAKFLFKIIGTAAFAFFIYGGFTMVLSMGNSDKVSHGRDTLVAAVVGLIIAFSAYLLVDVVLDVLNVSNDYRNVGNTTVESKK